MYLDYGYTVFLSFRGSDTGKSFTDHLYAALEQAGIHTFRDDDDDEIQRDEVVVAESQKALHESKMFLVVFSKSYASSIRCLDNLVKIMELRSSRGRIVVPIFYDASPSQVRKQSGSFADSFDGHKNVFEGEKDRVDRWRAVLREVADLGGIELQHRYEAELIKSIIKMAENKLMNVILHAPSYLVGIDRRVDDIKMWLEDGSDHVGMALIYGMGGIGKTTIAKAAYNFSFAKFEGSCFLANVRDMSKQPSGFLLLQKHLLEKILIGKTIKVNNVDEGGVKIKDSLSCKKVLIVFDDVDHLDQVKAIIGNWEWLGLGSKVIITARCGQLLKPFETYKKFKVVELDNDESLQLFCWHAFGQDHPINGFLEYTEEVLNHCYGLPLVLQVLGSSLAEKGLDEWDDEIKKLKLIPNSKIQKTLRISYDSLLDDVEKNLFLDIACFFIGQDVGYVTAILDGCGMYATSGIQNLINWDLLAITEDNKLKMHPLLRNMAREIVRQESPENPGKRSRLWYHKDAPSVLRDNMGSEAIRGLTLDVDGMNADKHLIEICSNCTRQQLVYPTCTSMPKRCCLGLFSWPSNTVLTTSVSKLNWLEVELNALANMRKLRLLEISCVKSKGGYENFPRSLIWLCWHGFPLKSIPSSLYMEKLVVLDLRYSSLRYLWNRTRFLAELKVLDMSHSHDLVSTPDFLGLPKLERLVLEDCLSLTEVHESIGALQRLVFMSLKDCRKLRKLPRSITNLKSLQKVVLSGCSKLVELPGELGEMAQ